MFKILLITVLTMLSWNASSSTYYKTGKIYNVNELMNNVNKDIEDYCKRNLSEFSKNINKGNNENQIKNNRYQLKLNNNNHSHSLSPNQQKLNMDACFNVEKQKFNNIINVYYNNNNEKEFLSCYEEVRKNRKESIADGFSNCLNDKRKDNCRYILKLDISPNEKALQYRECLM